MKLPNLLNRDVKVVEKRKIWFIISGVIILLAFVMGIVWGIDRGSPFNWSIDFTGGYTMTLRLSQKLTDENQAEFEDRIMEIAENLASLPTEDNPNPEPFGLRINRRDMSRQGEDETAAIYFRFRGVSVPSGDGRTHDEFMEYVNERFVEELMVLFAFAPQVVADDGTFVATYTDAVANLILEAPEGATYRTFRPQIEEQIIERGLERGVTIQSITLAVAEDGTAIARIATADFNAVEQLEAITHAMTIPDVFAGRPEHAGMTSATMGAELLRDALLALILALVLMLVYVAFRFDVSGGITAVTGLAHDLLIMFSFMVIFNVEIGVTFIAALITILGYSLNNTIILFDRVREKTKPYGSKEFNTKETANKAVSDTLFRSFATTMTGLFPMVAIAIIGLIGVPSITLFAFPIIIGLLAGTYSTLTILPSTWVALKDNWFKRQRLKKEGAFQKQILTPAVETSTETF